MLEIHTKLYRISNHVHTSAAFFVLQHEDCNLIYLFNDVFCRGYTCSNYVVYAAVFIIYCVVFCPLPSSMILLEGIHNKKKVSPF